MKKIAFIETESAEQAWLARELADHELQFGAELTDNISDAHILSIFLNTQVGAQTFARFPSLQLIVTRSTTTAHIDLAACSQRGIAVCNVPAYAQYSVAEHTFALILGLARRLREAMASITHHNFSYENVRGFELRGKTLGLVGAGRIGQHVLRMSKAFGLEAIVYDANEKPDLARTLGFHYVSFDELLQRADIISLHAPLTSDTYHLFNAETFARCKPGVLIVNTARGRLIDTNALCDALDAGIVAGAGLDVLEEERVLRRDTSHIISDQIIERLHATYAPRELRAPDNSRIQELQSLLLHHKLLERPNVLFTPHIAFNTHEAIERILRATVDNIRAYLAGEPANLVGTSVSSAY